MSSSSQPLFSALTTSGYSGYLLAIVVTLLLATILYAQVFADSTPQVTIPRDAHLPPLTKVTEIWTYPIKSCRGIKVESTRLKPTGVDFDRQWAIIDAATSTALDGTDGVFSRIVPSLEEVQVSKDELNSELQIKIEGTDVHVKIPSRPTTQWLESHCELTSVNIWDKQVQVWKYADDINAAFTTHLGNEVSLVYIGPKPRFVDGREPEGWTQRVVIASEASLLDLNKRMSKKPKDAVTMARFRPNVVIQGESDKPWSEDEWQRVQLISRDDENELLWKVELNVSGGCVRTRDASQALTNGKTGTKEMNAMLLQVRSPVGDGSVREQPSFGLNCTAQREGMLHVGANVDVLQTSS